MCVCVCGCVWVCGWGGWGVGGVVCVHPCVVNVCVCVCDRAKHDGHM